jgi:UDP-N-acetylglucosamine acyltransferase
MAEGNRATLRGLNLTGLRRHLKSDDIDKIKVVYKELFETGKPLKDIANELIEKTQNNHVHDLCSFILTTKRGIPYNRK